jgi:hypothetical protein
MRWCACATSRPRCASSATAWACAKRAGTTIRPAASRWCTWRRRRTRGEIELTYNYDDEDYGGARNFGHLAFGVDDIYATCAHLQAMGVTINRPPRDGRMAFVRSPDAISIELLQKGARAAAGRALDFDAEHRRLVDPLRSRDHHPTVFGGGNRLRATSSEGSHSRAVPREQQAMSRQSKHRNGIRRGGALALIHRRAIRSAALGLAVATAAPAFAGTCDVSDPANATCDGVYHRRRHRLRIDDLTLVVGGALATTIDPAAGIVGIDLYAGSGSIDVASAPTSTLTAATGISVRAPYGDVTIGQQRRSMLQRVWQRHGIDGRSYYGDIRSATTAWSMST